MWHERARMSSPCGLGELEQVVGGADERPFSSDLFEATQKELSEAPGMLDLSEDALDDLFSEPIAAAPARASVLGCHGGDARPFAPSPPPALVPFSVARAATSKESVDPAARETSEIIFISEASVSRDLAQIRAQHIARSREQQPECAAISHAILQALRDDNLISAVDSNDSIITLYDAAAARPLYAAVQIREVALRAIHQAAVRAALRLAALHHARVYTLLSSSCSSVAYLLPPAPLYPHICALAVPPCYRPNPTSRLLSSPYHAHYLPPHPYPPRKQAKPRPPQKASFHLPSYTHKTSPCALYH